MVTFYKILTLFYHPGLTVVVKSKVRKPHNNHELLGRQAK